MEGIAVSTTSRSQMVNITYDVACAIPADFNGVVVVFCQHTTAGLTVNENADPDVVHDILTELDRLVPWKNSSHRHMEGNSSAHMKATLVGSSVTVPVLDGRLALGTWQGIYFCEFDGPRSRRVQLRLLPSS